MLNIKFPGILNQIDLSMSERIAKGAKTLGLLTRIVWTVLALVLLIMLRAKEGPTEQTILTATPPRH